jgi:hypothetical protein
MSVQAWCDRPTAANGGSIATRRLRRFRGRRDRLGLRDRLGASPAATAATVAFTGADGFCASTCAATANSSRYSCRAASTRAAGLVSPSRNSRRATNGLLLL